jgi:hypothetical protein
MVRAAALAAIGSFLLVAACGAPAARGVPAAAPPPTVATQSSQTRVPIGDDAPTPTPAPAGHVPATAPTPTPAARGQVQACGLPPPARPAKVQLCPGT